MVCIIYLSYMDLYRLGNFSRLLEMLSNSEPITDPEFTFVTELNQMKSELYDTARSDRKISPGTPPVESIFSPEAQDTLEPTF